MTFHGLITGLVVLAVLLFGAAAASYRESLRRPDPDWSGWRFEGRPQFYRWTDSLTAIQAAMAMQAMTVNDARAAFERLSVFLSDFRYWLDDWEWEQ